MPMEHATMKIFSVDVESDGLYGESFAIAAIVTESRIGQVAEFQGRVITPPENTWCLENIWPICQDIHQLYGDSVELEEAFWQFWMDHKKDAKCIAHFGSPVESGLFRRCIERNPQRVYDGPYPLHEVATAIELSNGTSSVDDYITEHSLTVPFSGLSHHPMYDAMAALVVWHHIFSRRRHG